VISTEHESLVLSKEAVKSSEKLTGIL